MGVAGGRVPGVASWGPLCVALAAARADPHENLWGCITPRTLFAARGMQLLPGFPPAKKGVDSKFGSKFDVHISYHIFL